MTPLTKLIRELPDGQIRIKGNMGEIDYRGTGSTWDKNELLTKISRLGRYIKLMPEHMTIVTERVSEVTGTLRSDESRSSQEVRIMAVCSRIQIMVERESVPDTRHGNCDIIEIEFRDYQTFWLEIPIATVYSRTTAEMVAPILNSLIRL